MQRFVLLLSVIIVVVGSLFTFSCAQESADVSNVELRNPIIPGYFADPSIVEHEGKFYLYATVDPWGAEFLSCWVSEDFQHWEFHKLNYYPSKPKIVDKRGTIRLFHCVVPSVFIHKIRLDRVLPHKTSLYVASVQS